MSKPGKPGRSIDRSGSCALTPDDGMLMHSGALEFIPDTGMETQPFVDLDDFNFEDDLTFDQMVEAEPKKGSHPARGT